MYMEDAKELIEEQLMQTSSPDVTPEVLELDSYRMSSDTEVEEEQFLFRFGDTPCFARKELTTITGTPKSGKTFYTSMVMAACVRRSVMNLERIGEERLKVLWYDTEQSRSTTKEIMSKRLTAMMTGDDGLKADDAFPDEQFFVFNVRTASYQQRADMLALAVATYRPDVVIVDGISDLLSDINEGTQATTLTGQLLMLAEEYDCNVTAVIHLNRTGEKSNLRGWLGSVLLQKSFEVFNCAALLQTTTLSVEHTISRKRRCQQTLYYEVDDHGVPYTTKKPDIQMRDAQGKFYASEKVVEDKLNRDYIIDRPLQSDTDFEWDLRRLFTDAMGSLPCMGSEQLQQAVMRLSHIRQKQYYYKLLSEAEKSHIIIKNFDRCKRVVYMLTPR